MASPRFIAFLVLGIALTASGAACGSPQTDGSLRAPVDTPTNGPSGTSAASQTSNLAVPALYSTGQINLHDDDGYTWSTSGTFGGFDAPKKSVVDDKPGKASATVEVSGSTRTQNTLSGRNYVTPSIWIYGLYQKSRSACEILGTAGNFEGIDAADIRHNSNSLDLGDSGYCTVLLAQNEDAWKYNGDVVGGRTLKFEHFDEKKLDAGIADLVRGPDVYSFVHENGAYGSGPGSTIAESTCQIGYGEPDSFGKRSQLRVYHSSTRIPDCKAL